MSKVLILCPFYFVTDAVAIKARVFVSDKFLKANRIFESKTEAYPSGALHWPTLWVCKLLGCKGLIVTNTLAYSS